ncbi:GNAT family N-acetyltransferase [Albidovulum sediminicola]|uniref:GNAT family N-acetyltransferase n=1 Tax=Albidovulum sediminicola TaxID=2984331 RepID=A0ABT2YYZ1_9RHOB|nr:GNAT family N-acetyltransferase [Defluviimonas sp. WL0075]MCV2864105.1 GNAT family N-acetyltransferase [Defluviimonas sp. WL0075]
MTTPSFRTATLAEVATLLDWAAAEGWNPGRDDAAAFHAADPGGFFVACLDARPVAGISVVNHGERHAFLGLYLCLEAFRGRGIGLALWHHALAHAGERTVGLDGVAAQEGNYARSGFVRTGASLRLAGRVTPGTRASIRAMDATDLDAVAARDAHANGFARRAFITAWTAPTGSRRTVVLSRAGAPAGFATVRLCRDGAKIGPVVAPDAAAALDLIGHAATVFATPEVFVDLPEANRRLFDALTARGFEETFRTARMYRGAAPSTGPALQAIATMELG